MTFTEQIQKILIDLLANQLENENQIIHNFLVDLKLIIDSYETKIESLEILQQENTNLKERIDKAIAYIEKLEHSDWITFGRKILLEILKGEQKNEQGNDN